MRQRPITAIAAMTAIAVASPVAAHAQGLSSLLSSGFSGFGSSSGLSSQNEEVDPGFSITGPTDGEVVDPGFSVSKPTDQDVIDPDFSVAGPGGDPLPVDPGFSVAKPSEIGTPPFNTLEHAEEFLGFIVHIPPSALESDQALWEYLREFIKVQKENRAAGLEYIIGIAESALKAHVSAEYIVRLQNGINKNGGPVKLAEELARYGFDLSKLKDGQLARDLGAFPRP